MYRGGKICLTDHFKPLWARNVPKFGLAHLMALGLGPWLAVEIPDLIQKGVIQHKEKCSQWRIKPLMLGPWIGYVPVFLCIPLTHLTASLTPLHLQRLLSSCSSTVSSVAGVKKQCCYWVSKLGCTGRGKAGALENRKVIYIPSPGGAVWDPGRTGDSWKWVHSLFGFWK